MDTTEQGPAVGQREKITKQTAAGITYLQQFGPGDMVADDLCAGDEVTDKAGNRYRLTSAGSALNTVKAVQLSLNADIHEVRPEWQEEHEYRTDRFRGVRWVQYTEMTEALMDELGLALPARLKPCGRKSPDGTETCDRSEHNGYAFTGWSNVCSWLWSTLTPRQRVIALDEAHLRASRHNPVSFIGSPAGGMLRHHLVREFAGGHEEAEDYTETVMTDSLIYGPRGVFMVARASWWRSPDSERKVYGHWIVFDGRETGYTAAQSHHVSLDRFPGYRWESARVS